ncbi:MAG: sulfatase [Armatimonadota bacterium]
MSESRYSVRRRRLLRAAAATVGLVLTGIVVARPWADSALTAQVTISTDGSSPVVAMRLRRLFSAEGRELPVYRAEVDLTRWAGKLVRIDVNGRMLHRGLGAAPTGRLACRAEIVGADGTIPLEFPSWQFGGAIGLHPRRLGPVVFDAPSKGERESPFVFAGTGTLWHVLRVAPSARLRISMTPLPDSMMEGLPRAHVATPERAAGRPALPPRLGTRKPDVFIYLVDALRPDHLGCFGYPRGTSPFIDAFVREAALYEQAFAAGTWTRSSVATILTGLCGAAHGAVHETDALAEWPVLLPEVLRGQGYTTRCISANGNVTAELGFDQGYDEFIFSDRAPASWISQLVERRLAAQDPRKPVFMYLHTVETHGPLTPGPEPVRRFDRGLKGRYGGTSASLDKISVLHPKLTEADIGHLVDLYDASVFEADQGFRQFISALKKTGRYENSLIILLSDHGEAFSEHDTFGHGWDLTRETMHVMLAVKCPAGRYAGTRVRDRVSLVDVAPTVFYETGLRPGLLYPLEGRPLAPDRMEKGRRIYAETSMWEANNLDLVAVIDEDGCKRVIDASVPPRETASKQTIGLWDTNRDPNEQADLSAKLPVRAAYGEQLIASWLLDQYRVRTRSATGPTPKIQLSDELRRTLKDLGYLRGGGASPAGEKR